MRRILSRSLAAICAALTLGLGGPAEAQFREPVTLLGRYSVGAEGVCPTETDPLVQDRVRRPSTFVNTGFGSTFFIDAELNPGFENAFPTAPRMGVLPPLFARIFLLGESEDGARWLAAWSLGDEARRCAWLPVSAFLGADEAHNIKDLRDGPPVMRVRDIEALSDPDVDSRNTLSVKVVLSNLNVSGDDGVPVYASPDAATPRGFRALFELYAVYDFKLGTPRKNNNAAHFLIGKDEVGSQELTGWVHQEDVFEWNSRMAVYGAVPGLSAYTEEETLNGIRLVESLIVSNIPYTETEGESRQRFPVVQTEPDAPVIKERVDNLYARGEPVGPLDRSRQVDGYQVVLPTENCNFAGADCLSAEEFEERRREYQRIVDSLNNIDILLLLDSTESMDRYFTPTAEAVGAFAEETLTGDTLADAARIRVSAFVYGDYNSGKADIEDITFLNVMPWHQPTKNSPELRDMSRFAANFARLAPKDPERDKYEASLAAVIRAARDGGWRDEAGYRMIVHLADHGSRPLNRTSGEAGSALVERISVEDAVAALREGSILYVPISVVGRAGAEAAAAKAARAAFIEQGGAIQDASGIRPSVARSYTSVEASETDEERQAAVLEALDEIWTFNALTRNTVLVRERCAVNPGHPTCPILAPPTGDGTSGARVVAFLDETMGLTREQIENIYSRRDNVVKVWLKPLAEGSEGGEVEALSYWVAIDNKRFEDMWRGFDALCSLIEPSDQGRDISARIVDGFGPIIGELANEGDREFYRGSPLSKTLSLPFIERSKYLSYTPAEIESIIDSNQPDEMRELRGTFCRTSFLFENVVGDVRLTVTQNGRERAPTLDELELDRNGFVIGTGEARIENDYKWLVKIDRGEGIVFVPFEYFP